MLPFLIALLREQRIREREKTHPAPQCRTPGCRNTVPAACAADGEDRCEDCWADAQHRLPGKDRSATIQ